MLCHSAHPLFPAHSQCIIHIHIFRAIENGDKSSRIKRHPVRHLLLLHQLNSTYKIQLLYESREHSHGDFIIKLCTDCTMTVLNTEYTEIVIVGLYLFRLFGSAAAGWCGALQQWRRATSYSEKRRPKINTNIARSGESERQRE